MAKRGNGEGTIYFSEKLNKWVGQFTAGKKADGKLNRKSVYGNTRKEVKEKITKALSEVQTHTFIDKNTITVFDLGKKIQELKLTSNTITPSTYARNQNTFNIICKSNIAQIEIQKITSFQIQEFLNQQIKYSDSTIDKIHGMLSVIFTESIKRDIIYKNPMLNVIKPKSLKQKKQIDALSVEEQKLFLKEVITDDYKNILLIALHSGMRIGEILALTIDDIDFDNKLIYINNTLSRDEKGTAIIGKKTKTYNSIRQIPLTIVLEPILKESISNYIPNKNKLLFCQPDGKLIEHSTINSHFKRICKNANIKVDIYPLKRKDKIINLKTSNVNTHMLRHTYATRCIEAGVPAEVLQKLLGHKDISITINTYTTIFDKFKNDALNNYINYIQNI